MSSVAPPKRQRRSSSSPSEPAKRHRPNNPTPILRLSDELFLRICVHLPTRDLASFQLASHRCSRIAVDGQIWKALYYRRYVRPRASRIPGLARARVQLGDYSSRTSRWLEDEGISREVGTNWKALYRLRHNWGRGSCGVREIDVVAGHHDAAESGSDLDFLVKLFEGIVVTASSKYGLRAWRLHGSDELVAQTALYSNTVPFSSAGAPTALAIDEESRLEGDDGVVNVTVGFSDGSFTMYQLDISSKQTAVFRIKYVHAMREHVGEITRATSITAMASLGPFLSTVAGHTWSIYEFYGSLPDGTSIGIDVMGVGRGVSNGGVDAVDNDSSSNSRMMQSPHAPKLLTSLRSSTAWPPIALSLRRSINGTLLASIIYAHPLSTSGWSVGMQELRFWTSNGSSDIADNHKTTETALKESRIATAVPSGFTALSNLGDGASPGMSSGRGAGGMATGMDGVSPITGHSGRSQLFDPPLAQPTSLSYCHPYLITSHGDNTLTLYLVRSTGSSLAIDSGQRLYGHTAGVSSVLVDSRGKAVSINRNGSEVRVWELEGGVSERRSVNASVRICGGGAGGDQGSLGGFDDEKVVVLLRAGGNSADSAEDVANTQGKLVVYDFTRSSNPA